MIVVASCFRNSTDYLGRYMKQVDALRDTLDEAVYVIAVEGDSTDHTYNELVAMEFADELLKVEHGGRVYGHIVHPQRFRQLATVGNMTLCVANRVMTDNDRFVYVESDLSWEPETIVGLLDRVGPVHGVAPMVMAEDEARFYDTWGFQIDGRMFLPYPPYYVGYRSDAMDLVQIETAGSCFALDRMATKIAEFSPHECIRGIGKSLAFYGMSFWLDPTLTVYHPAHEARLR